MLRKLSVAALIVCLLATIKVSINAEEIFTDITGHIYKDQITQLYQEGIIKGVGNHQYSPEAALTNAQALQLYVNVFKLNLDRFRFFKQPLATDYFPKADNNAWYADALIIASANGIEADGELVPIDAITRESFYHLLITQMENQYAFPMMKLIPVSITDEENIDASFQGSIQRGISYGIIALNEDKKFNPKANLTRAEAANAIVLALDYLRLHEYISKEAKPFQTSLTSEVIGEEINFAFDINNLTDINQTITFSSSQTFDFDVYNSKNEHVYNWSSVRSFMMMIQDVSIVKGGHARYEIPWDYKDASGTRLPSGSYKVIFTTNFMYGEEPIELSSEVMIDIVNK